MQDTIAVVPVRHDHTRLITGCIAATIFLGPLSLAGWIPLHLMARREKRRTLLRWSGAMIALMAGVVVALSLHLVLGTHGHAVLGS